MAKISKQLVKEVVGELTGKDGVKLMNCIYNDSIAEEDIAKKMKQEIKQTRNVLYQLQEHHLVKFKRQRNDINGWYTYFWSFNKERVNDLSKRLKEAKLERLNYRLNVEENTQFFTCKNKCLRVDFEGLMNFDYQCPECGCCLEQHNNKKIIKELKTKIKDIKKCIKC